MPSKRKNMRKVPLFIQTRLSSFGHHFRVAVVQNIDVRRIQAGEFATVGLSLSSGIITGTASALPDVALGRYSRRNVEGQILPRHDLPRIAKTISFINTRPFGRYGPCQVTQVRQVLQREHVPGPQYRIGSVPLLVGDTSCVVRFELDTVFSALDPNIDRNLLFALNLLNEAVGGVNVFPPDASTQDYLDTIHVHWEILPAGERESNIRLLVSGFRPQTQEAAEELERRANERYSLFESLSPRYIIRGTGGLNGYMGAVIDDQTVVFEHLAPGNATYVLFADWAIQSQRTKTDLLANGVEGKDYIRVIHSGDWQDRLRNVVADRIQ